MAAVEPVSTATDLEIELLAAAYRNTEDPDFAWAFHEAERRKLEVAPATPAVTPLKVHSDFPIKPTLQLSYPSTQQLAALINNAFVAKLESLGVQPDLARTVTIDIKVMPRSWVFGEERRSCTFSPRFTVDREPWCAARSYRPPGSKQETPRASINYQEKGYEKTLPVNDAYVGQLHIVEKAVEQFSKQLVARVEGGSVRKAVASTMAQHCITGMASSHPRVTFQASQELYADKFNRYLDKETPLCVAEVMNEFCAGYPKKGNAKPIDLEPFRQEARAREEAREKANGPYCIDEAQWIFPAMHLPATPDSYELSNRSQLALAAMIDKMLVAKLKQLGVPAPLAESFVTSYSSEWSHRYKYPPQIHCSQNAWRDARQHHDQNKNNQNKTDWPWLKDAAGGNVKQLPPEYAHPAATCAQAFHDIARRLCAVSGKELGEDESWYGPHELMYDNAFKRHQERVTPLQFAQAINAFCAEYGGVPLDCTMDLTPFEEEARQRHPEKYLPASVADKQEEPGGEKTLSWGNRLSGLLQRSSHRPTPGGREA